jgi:hypothetical protein
MIIAGCGHPGEADTRRDLAGGALHARVVAHTVETPVESVPCWTYVTDGLLAVGQKELTLTVAREAGENSPPPSPFGFFETAWELAKSGRIVDVGDFTKFSKGELFGAPRPPRHHLRAGAIVDRGHVRGTDTACHRRDGR